MWAAIQTAFTSFIGMVGELVTALTDAQGSLSGLLPLFAIGIAISIFMVGLIFGYWGQLKRIEPVEAGCALIEC